MKNKTIFDELLEVMHDEDFCPQSTSMPTSAMPGSYEKIEVMAKRVMRGESLWHKDDTVIRHEIADDRASMFSREMAITPLFGRGLPTD